MFNTIRDFFKSKPVEPKDYLCPVARSLLSLESLELMRRNQDHDVIMHLVFGEPNLASVAKRLGVERHEVMDAISASEARKVAFLELASAVLANSGLQLDVARRKKLRKLYQKTKHII